MRRKDAWRRAKERLLLLHTLLPTVFWSGQKTAALPGFGPRLWDKVSVFPRLRGRIPRRAHAIAGDYFLLFTLLFRSHRGDGADEDGRWRERVEGRGGQKENALRAREGRGRRDPAEVRGNRGRARGRIDLIPRHEKCPPV